MKLSDFFRANGWTQKVWARDADGHEAPVHSPNAVCWCLGGGTYRVGMTWTEKGCLNDAIQDATGLSLTVWNDVPGRTKTEVVALLAELGF